MFSLILSFDLDFIMRPFLTIWGPIASFGVGMVGFKNCFTVSSFIPITFVFLVWLDSNYILEFWVCVVVVVGGWTPAIDLFQPNYSFRCFVVWVDVGL